MGEGASIPVSRAKHATGPRKLSGDMLDRQSIAASISIAPRFGIAALSSSRARFALDSKHRTRLHSVQPSFLLPDLVRSKALLARTQAQAMREHLHWGTRN